MTIELGLDTFGDITRGDDGKLVSHAQAIRQVIDEAVLADEVGADFIGVGEHHREDFAISAPEVLLGAIAGRTRRIKLGSAVTVLSSDDPIRVFQRFATLDAASSGRAEIILGRGSFTESFPLFGFPLSKYEVLFEEKLELFAAVLHSDRTGEPVSWQGTTRPPLEVKRVYPTTENGLKVWIGVGGSPESVVRAARYQFPLTLAIIGGDPRRFRSYVSLYRQALTQLNVPLLPVGVHSPGHIADTDERAREEMWPAFKGMHDRIGAERGWPPMTRAQFDSEVERGSLYVGSPETVAHKIANTVRELDVNRFDLKYSAGTLSHDKMMRSIELFGRTVMPRVRELVSENPVTK